MQASASPRSEAQRAGTALREPAALAHLGRRVCVEYSSGHR